MKAEIEGIYKCPRGEFDCDYIVEYRIHEISDSFAAHNELGSIQDYEYIEQEVEIEHVSVRVFYNEDTPMLISEIKPDDILKQHLIDTILR